MRVAVCVKEVPDTAAPRRIDPHTLRLDRSGEGTLNPWDLSAVEEALRIQSREGGEVVCLSMGPERTMTSLRKALAMGADRAVLVTDPLLEGADLVVTSRVLAGALVRETADLVLLGQQGQDSDGAVLWAAVATRLELPLISQAASLVLAGGRATVKRQTEYGYDVIEAPLPCVVAVSDAINEPRYPSLKGIMGAKKKPQDVITLSELGIDAPAAGSKTQVRALGPPPPRGESLIVEDDGSAAQTILDYLVEHKLL